MTVQNLIAIGGLLAAVFSALAAAFAVIQSKLQRTTLTKPQLIVTSITIPVVHKSGEIFSITPKGLDSNAFKVPIKNVGLGTALNLKYSWKFDYKKLFKLCGFSYTDTHPMLAFHSGKRTNGSNKTFFTEEDLENKTSYYAFFNENQLKSYSIKETQSDLEYIIPITQDDSSTMLSLPYLIPALTINQFADQMLITDMMLKETDAGTLKVEYEDISGYKFLIGFACCIKMISYRSNGEHGPEAVYELKFHRLQNKSRSTKVLNVFASIFHSLKKHF